MNCDELRDRMLSFPRRYLVNFDYVWRWKVSVEDEVTSVLDEDHRNEAFKRLVKILRARTSEGTRSSLPRTYPTHPS